MITNSMTNEEYHANSTHLSSSAFKSILKDIGKFYDRYILKNYIKEESAALDIGTATHYAVLEPHLFDQNVVIFEEGDRKGKEWKIFKEQHSDKIILKRTEMKMIDAMLDSFKKHRFAFNLLAGCKFEETVTGTYNGLDVKCRYDGINLDKKYIIDIKTTRYPSGKENFLSAAAQQDYALSAHLYENVAGQNFSSEFDFYYIVLSKSDFQCRVYKASSEHFKFGLQRLEQAIDIYRICELTGQWQLDYDYI